MQPASNEEEQRAELKNIEARYSKFRDGSDEQVKALSKLPHEASIWLPFFLKFKQGAERALCNEMRRVISIQTLHCCIRLSYPHPVSRALVPLFQQTDLLGISQRTKLIDYGAKDSLTPPVPGKNHTSFYVCERDCLELAQDFVGRGLRPVVLNMTSDKRAGGEWRTGAGALEENLFRRSTFCLSLEEEFNKDKRRKWTYPLPEFGVIYSPENMLFRGTELNGYPYLPAPVPVSFISCSAYRSPKLVFTEKKEPRMGQSWAVGTERKIHAILRTALDHGHDVLVLSAFGCGAFCNPPRHVAEIIRTALLGPFGGHFKAIAFAILDDGSSGRQHNPLGNYRPFVETFEAETEHSPPLTTFGTALSSSAGANATQPPPTPAAPPPTVAPLAAASTPKDLSLLTSGIIPNSVGLAVQEEPSAPPSSDDSLNLSKGKLPGGKRPEHNFVSRSLHRPTFCPVCKKLVASPFGKLGHVCQSCGVRVHEQCLAEAKKGICATRAVDSAFDSFADLQVPLQGVLAEDVEKPLATKSPNTDTLNPSLYASYNSTRSISPRAVTGGTEYSSILSSTPPVSARRDTGGKEKEKTAKESDAESKEKEREKLNAKEKERLPVGKSEAADAKAKTKRSDVMLPSPDTTPILPTIAVAAPAAVPNSPDLAHAPPPDMVPPPLSPSSSLSALVPNVTLLVGNTCTKDRVLESGMTLFSWTVYIREPSPGIIGWVEFKLHPSFTPDYLQRRSPPFEISRVGWGVFPVKIRLHLSTGRAYALSWDLQFARPEQSKSFEVSVVPISPGDRLYDAASHTHCAGTPLPCLASHLLRSPLKPVPIVSENEPPPAQRTSSGSSIISRAASISSALPVTPAPARSAQSSSSSIFSSIFSSKKSKEPPAISREQAPAPQVAEKSNAANNSAAAAVIHPPQAQPEATVVVTPAGRRSWPALSLTCAHGTSSYVRGTLEGPRGVKDVFVKFKIPIIPSHQTSIQNDMFFLSLLSGHPRVVHPLGSIVREQKNSQFTHATVYPLMPNLGVLLRDCKLKFTYPVVLRIAIQVAELLCDLSAKGIVHGAVRADNVWLSFSDLADKPRILTQPVAWFKRDEVTGNWKPFRESHSQLAEVSLASYAAEMRHPHLSYCVALSERTGLNLCESFRFNRTTFQRKAALRLLRPPEETTLKELRLTEDTQVDAMLGGFDVARKGSGEVALDKLCKAVAAPEVIRSGQVTAAADIYGFSMLLCEMLVAPVSVDPKPDEDEVTLGRRPKALILSEDCPRAFSKLITECWNADPNLRPTPQQLLARLQAIETRLIPVELLLKQLNLHQYIGVAERAAVDMATLASSSKSEIVDLGFPIGVATAIYKHLNTQSDVSGLVVIRRAQLVQHEKLGEGFFGSVFRATWNGTTEVAVKMLKAELSTDTQIEELKSEAAVLRKIPPHPNVLLYLGLFNEVLVNFLSVMLTRGHQGNEWGIVTEIVPGGSLKRFLMANLFLRDDQLLALAKSAACGMQHLASLGIIHRDLSARNLLVGGQIDGHYTLKVADFGLARAGNVYQRHTSRVPVKWTAPEALRFGQFSLMSDVWSFGVTLYEIMTRGEDPYPGKSESDVLDLVKAGGLMVQPSSVDKDVWEVMLSCWKMKAEERPPFDALYHRLRSLEEAAVLSHQPTAELVSDDGTGNDVDGYVEVAGA